MSAWSESVAGHWGVCDLEDADLDGARVELSHLLDSPAFAEPDPWNAADPTLGLPAASPLAQLAADLPVDARWNLIRHLGRANLLEPLALDDKVAAVIVAPYTWLLGRIGAEGMTLTKAGWMPPAAVLEGMTTLGWRDTWIGEANREDITVPMRNLRASATRLRLIRSVKGRLEVLARVRKDLDRPVALAETIARMLLRQRLTDGQRLASTLLVLGVADGSVTTSRGAERSVLTMLNDLGYTTRDGRPLDWQSYRALVDPVLEVLETLGMWGRRRRESPPTDGLRAIARNALL